MEAFEARVASIDAVVECRRMFGIPDYIIRVAVADVDAYEAVYINELAELPGVGRVNSQFTMKLVKTRERARITLGDHEPQKRRASRGGTRR